MLPMPCNSSHVQQKCVLTAKLGPCVLSRILAMRIHDGNRYRGGSAHVTRGVKQLTEVSAERNVVDCLMDLLLSWTKGTTGRCGHPALVTWRSMDNVQCAILHGSRKLKQRRTALENRDAQGRAITVILRTARTWNFCACRAGVTPELTGSYHAPVGSASEFHVVAVV